MLKFLRKRERERVGESERETVRKRKVIKGFCEKITKII